jgi:hypothetical protein
MVFFLLFLALLLLRPVLRPIFWLVRLSILLHLPALLWRFVPGNPFPGTPTIPPVLHGVWILLLTAWFVRSLIRRYRSGSSRTPAYAHSRHEGGGCDHYSCGCPRPPSYY